MGKKKFWVKKVLGQKIFVLKKFLVKRFFGQKNLRSKKFLGQKELGPKKFLSKKTGRVKPRGKISSSSFIESKTYAYSNMAQFYNYCRIDKYSLKTLPGYRPSWTKNSGKRRRLLMCTGII